MNLKLDLPHLILFQEFLLHERLMFEQKGLRTAGEDWQRHHLQQDKPAGLGVLHYPQPVHQQGPLESSKVCIMILILFF